MGRHTRDWINKLCCVVADEQGVEMLEFLGIMPLVFMIFLVAWQFIQVGFTGIVSSATSREGARAAVTLESVSQAVQWASHGFDGRREWSASGSCMRYSGGPLTMRARLEVPHVSFPFLGELGKYPRVETRSTMRCEPPFDAP